MALNSRNIADPAISLAIHLLAPMHQTRPITALVAPTPPTPVGATDSRNHHALPPPQQQQEESQGQGQLSGEGDPPPCWQQQPHLHQPGRLLMCHACCGGEPTVCVQVRLAGAAAAAAFGLNFNFVCARGA